MIEKLSKDFPSVDFSFIRNNSDVTYYKATDLNDFKSKFFNKVKSEGLMNNIQVILGEPKIKYLSEDIYGAPILVCFLNDLGATLKYEFMGVTN